MLEVYSYGSGECDQLGLGDCEIFESKVPRKVIIFNTDINNKVYKICCGGMHSVVLTTMGKVFTWGCGDEGTLGREGLENTPNLVPINEPMNNITAGDCHTIVYNTEYNLAYMWGSYRNPVTGKIGESILSPTKIDMNKFGKSKLKKIISGNNHTLLLSGSSLYAWGDGISGQIGRNPDNDNNRPQTLTPQKFGTKNVIEIFTAANHSFLITEKGNKKYIKAWGLNNYSQLGIGNTENQWIPEEVKFFKDVSVKNITGGDFHTILLTEQGEIYTWGKNDEGQCGFQNSEEIILTPRKVTFLNEHKISNIASSMNYNYAIDFENNNVYSWGMGESYVLGNKSDRNENIPFSIPREFYYNMIVDQISLGAQHVIVGLVTDALNRPSLEYISEKLKLSEINEKTKRKKRRNEISEIVEQASKYNTGNISNRTRSKTNKKLH